MYMRHISYILEAVSLLGSPGGATIRQMQDRLAVSRRTVYRLLEALEGMGIPLYEEEIPLEREKRWRVQEGYLKRLPNLAIPRLALTGDERLLLSFLLSGAGVLGETAIAKPLAALRQKLSAALEIGAVPAHVVDGINSLFVRTRTLAKDYTGKEELIEQLAEAVLDRHTCVVSYHALSTGQVREFRVDPLRLVEHRGGLYVFVRVTRFGDIRILAVDRIQSLEITDVEFERPADFDADTMLENAFDLTFGDPLAVRVWVSPQAAPYVRERRWAATQSVEEAADGSLVLSLETSGFEDVKRWVLSFGPAAKVLEPAALAEAVRDEARMAAEAYGR